MRWRREDLAYLAGLILGLGILVGFGFVDFRERAIDTDDFSYIWLGPRVVLDGGDPYLGADWLPAVERYGVQHGPEAFYVYEPHVAVALLPLGALPLRVASNLWTYGGMVIAALGVGALLRVAAPGRPIVAWLAGLALFVSQPGVTTFWSGQWTFLLVGALAWAAAGALGPRARGTAAGLALLGKPHLFVFAAVGITRALVSRGRGRAVALLLAAAALVVLVPLAAFPRWLADETGDLGTARLAGQRAPTTLVVALHDLAGDAGTVAAFAVIVGGLVLLWRLDARGPCALAAACAFSLVAAPYSWSYDQLVLLVPLVIVSGALESTVVSAAVLGAFLFLPGLLYVIASARGNESFQAFIPLLAFAVAAAAARRERHRSAISRP